MSIFLLTLFVIMVHAYILINTICFYCSCLFSNDQHNVMYMDFAKAFDSVPHKRLISKVNALGIKGDILQWIQSFLSDRKQIVVVEVKPSSWENVISGFHKVLCLAHYYL